MTLNVLALAALADLIATFFSEDAAHWPVTRGNQRAIPVQWIGGERGEALRQVVEALNARTIAPYRPARATSGIPIVTASEQEPAVAVVAFWREPGPDDEPGLRYELRFTAQGQAVRRGWFSIAAGRPDSAMNK